MTWLSYIFASAATLALYDICKKHSAAGNRTFNVLLLTSTSGFLTVLATLAATGGLAPMFALAPREYVLLGVKSLVVSTSWALAYMALKTLPITVMAPIRATGPVWTTLAALAIYKEIPSAIQALGFALAFTGSFAFSLATRREGFTLHSKAIVLAIAATLAGSASALYDKFILNSLKIPPKAVLFWFMFAMSVIYAIAVAITRKSDKTRFEWRWTIPFVGVLLAMSDFCYFSALSSPEARISVISTIRRVSTVATFVIGGALFHEKNLLRKGIALAAIIAGVVLLAV